MLYEKKFIPVITKPTRITDHTKTLIDHIYTNTPIDQVVSGIGLFSDIYQIISLCFVFFNGKS